MKLHLPKNLRIAIHSCLAVASGIATTVGTGFVVGGSFAIALVSAHAQAEINDLPANVTGDDAALDLNQPDVKLVSTSPADEMENYNSGNSVTPDIIDSSSTDFYNVVPRMLTDGVTLQQEAYSNPPLTIDGRKSGSCEYTDYESISFEDIDDGYSSGGAIYGGLSSTITLSDNGSVLFDGNTVSSSSGSANGGAIAGYNDSTITLSGNGSVTFSENTACSSGQANAYGGAIYGDWSSTITLSDNGSVLFDGNTATTGGAIYGDWYSTITLSNNGSVTFDGNTVSGSSSAYGGAIYGGRYSTITLSDNGSVLFDGNTATTGGAIYGDDDSTITLSDNGSVTFSGNTATTGGAIYGDSITLSGNGSVTFSGNTASSSRSGGVASGGAISGTITLSDNDSVLFDGNTACSSGQASGGAISGDSITLSGNGSVTFSGNTASSSDFSTSGGGIFFNSAFGGAISGNGSSSTITLSGNGSVTFSGNTASSSYFDAYGGAISGYGSSNTITLNENGSVTFSGNTASSSDGSAYGGAIYGYTDSTLTLSGNESVTFDGNTACSSYIYGDAYGGAISGYGSSNTITLNENGSVTFSGNTASSSSGSAYGGAICTDGNLNIRNNDSVLFEKNAEIHNGSYRLRSIYAEPYDSDTTISFSAGEGRRIEFRDSIYIDYRATVNFNEDYTDTEGVVHKQTGDIIFSGKYAEQHLNEILAANNENRTATAEEILNSQTSEIGGNLYVNGGSLQIVDGAVVKVNGDTVSIEEGSNATLAVSDAELVATNTTIEVGASATLQLSNGASVTADEINIAAGATLAIGDIAVTTSAIDSMVAAYRISSLNVINGDLTFAAGSTLVTDGSGIRMTEGSVLTFNATSEGEKINLVFTLGTEYNEDTPVQLFSNVDIVKFLMDGKEVAASTTLLASDFFTGAGINDSTTLHYDSANKVVYLQGVSNTIPEPTTATLSLLALAALAMRRRRK